MEMGNPMDQPACLDHFGLFSIIVMEKYQLMINQTRVS